MNISMSKAEGAESEYVEKIQKLSADELFDNFDDFCQLGNKISNIDSYFKYSHEVPDLDTDLLCQFNYLAFKDFEQTTTKKETSKCLPKSISKQTAERLQFSDLLYSS